MLRPAKELTAIQNTFEKEHKKQTTLINDIISEYVTPDNIKKMLATSASEKFDRLDISDPSSRDIKHIYVPMSFDMTLTPDDVSPTLRVQWLSVVGMAKDHQISLQTKPEDQPLQNKFGKIKNIRVNAKQATFLLDLYQLGNYPNATVAGNDVIQDFFGSLGYHVTSFPRHFVEISWD